MGATAVEMSVVNAPVVSIVMVFAEKSPAEVGTLETVFAISIALPSRVTCPPLVRIPASAAVAPNSPVRSLIDNPLAAAAHTLFAAVSPGAF